LDLRTEAVGKSIDSLPKAAPKAAPKKDTSKAVAAGLSAFGKAFSQARKEGKKEFPFEGAQYAAYTKQEVEKAGKSNLGEYLNSLKRQNTEIAKAPGQMKKGGMVMARGNKLARSKPTKMY
jgi:murein endopeptidase